LKDNIQKETLPVFVENGKEERLEELPDLITLRNDYSTLSQQLEQLDANKQAGQWARLYKQMRAAEERLHHAEQDVPAPSEPQEDARQRDAQASAGGTALPTAET
jgi:chromosome segregation ATPase